MASETYVSDFKTKFEFKLNEITISECSALRYKIRLIHKRGRTSKGQFKENNERIQETK
jgi:hypothetical protein